MRLTKTSLAILGVISLLALAEYFPHNWQTPIWPLLAATWLFLLFCEQTLLWFQKIKLERRLDRPLYLGTPTSVDYHLTNRDKYPVRLLTQELLPPTVTAKQNTLEWNLGAHESLTQSIRVTPLTLAPAPFSRIRLKILGRLALAWWTRDIPMPHTVDVLPEYRTTPTNTRHTPDVGTTLSRLRTYRSVTLVLNAGYLNQLVSGDLRRIDHYINACTRLAYRALNAHRTLNIIIYAKEIQLIMREVKTPTQLGELFNRLQHDINADDAADHRCVFPQLDRISQADLLVWYTDLDDADKNIELAKMLTHYKQRFDIQLYSLQASEAVILNEELRIHRRHPYHQLEIRTLQHQRRASREILQRAGIPVISA